MPDGSAPNLPFHAQLDGLTGVYGREALLALLFRETDRVQRMHTALSVVLLGIDDFGDCDQWDSRPGLEVCDGLLRQVAGRTSRLLRSYDLLGHAGKDQFLIALPGCGAIEATRLAERLRDAVFGVPFQVEGESIQLSACFGIACSQGRSPVVVLREAKEALRCAKAAGLESIHYTGELLFGERMHLASVP
ncbi:MAG TPA: GGDEF domain-containing protein [Terracidiphilus sp.]|jgi:diguanylate cyclase (GGDEF)-like protein